MLESITIFTTGGCILYQYCSNPSLVKQHNISNSDNNDNDTNVDHTTSTTTNGSSNPSYTRHLINTVVMEQFIIPELMQSDISASSSTTTTSTSSGASSTTNDDTTTAIKAKRSYHITDGMTLYWKHHTIVVVPVVPSNDNMNAAVTNSSNNNNSSNSNNNNNINIPIYIVAIYPDILFEGPRQYLKVWIEYLVSITIQEYTLYYTTSVTKSSRLQQQQQQVEEEEAMKTTTTTTTTSMKQQLQMIRPDPTLFDPIFNVLLTKSKSQKHTIQQQQPTSENETTTTTNVPSNTSTPSTTTTTTTKTQRNWYDNTMNNKVTEKAMAALDKSNDGNTSKESIQLAKEEQYERALREARMAYLPNEQEIQNNAIKDGNNNNNNESDGGTKTLTQSSWIVGIFQQVMGTKVLTKQDLQKPIEKIITLLQQKNVSLIVAKEIGTAIEKQLIGQTLQSFYTIQTAVQQALESIIIKILNKNVVMRNNISNIDLIQNVLHKKNSQSSIWSSISTITTNSKRRPFVITVMGINGIGKTTTIAKIAYYLQQHNCTPLLVAGDTFRSGAIEQLRIHADCLNVPFYQQGYSKDPSSVAKNAIQHAIEQQYDVVLIDTAGRMQNNIPLMKSLNKLMIENQPDYCIMVCEAIVGHDGMNQFTMFQKALGNERKVDGIILTKFDTIDTKVGVCLTLTYECNTPILFLGTGQKYHHLQPLHVSTIIKGLFA